MSKQIKVEELREDCTFMVDLSEAAYDKGYSEEEVDADLVTFLKTEQSPWRLFGKPFFAFGTDVFVVLVDNVFCGMSDNEVLGAEKATLKEYKVNACAALTPDKVFVSNGDEYETNQAEDSEAFPILDYMHVQCLYEKCVTLSFLCVSRFFKTPQNKHPIQNVAEMFARGTLHIVDYTPDSTMELTQKQKELVKKGKIPAAPTGYSYVNGGWHRAASVLVHDTRKNGKSYLFGVDEGSYFGVELPTSPQTISEAYRDLIPKQARNKEGVKRQGEWFAVPIDKNKVPLRSDCLAFTDDDDSAWALPIEHEDSSIHWLEGRELRMGKDGVIYARNFALEHSASEHQMISGNGWYVFYRNTAIRSFSQQGVD